MLSTGLRFVDVVLVTYSRTYDDAQSPAWENSERRGQAPLIDHQQYVLPFWSIFQEPGSSPTTFYMCCRVHV